MTDNFKLFEEYVYYSTPNRGRTINDDPDKYYVVEIIKRGKDHNGMTGNNIHFKNYYINKISDLYRFEPEIKKLCDVFGMRAYVSVNYKSYEQVTKDTCLAYADRIVRNDFAKPYRLWESCSGKYVNSNNKRWIIDLDEGEYDEYIDDLINMIWDCRPEGQKVFSVFPTRTGKHLITNPFDIDQFMEKFEEFNNNKGLEHDPKFLKDRLKKNHLTLLYENLDREE